MAKGYEYHEDEQHQPRWNTAGYWTNRREGENWPGDRSRTRNYNREDIRRYNQRSLEQGEALRRMRGQGPDPRDRRTETRTPHSRDQRRYGESYRKYEDEYDLPDVPRRHPRWAELRNRRNRLQSPGISGRAPARHPDRYRFEPRVHLRPGRSPGEDLVDNYWGRREMRRADDLRDRGAWWNQTGGRPDVTSARRYRNDLPTRPRMDWGEEPDYDLDPGYGYEFGTDFDFLDAPEFQDFPGEDPGIYRRSRAHPRPARGRRRSQRLRRRPL